MEDELGKMSLLGRLMRVHVLDATPVLYPKPSPKWTLFIILLVLILGLLTRL